MMRKAIATLFLLVLAGVGIPLFSSCAFLQDERNPHMFRQKDAAAFIGSIRPYRGDPESHYLLGCYLQERNKHKPAVEEFIKAVKIDPTHTRAYNGMGVSYDSIGEFSKAIDAYKEAIKLDPNLDYVHNNLGYSHLLNGNLDSAIASFKRAVALNDKERLYHNNLGLAYATSGKYNLALHEFKLAVGEDRAHASLAKIIRRNGSKDEAAAQLAAAPIIKPSDTANNDLEAAEILANIFSGNPPLSTEKEERIVPESRHEEGAQLSGVLMINPSDKSNHGKEREALANSFTASAENAVMFVAESQPKDTHGHVAPAIKIEVSNGNGVNRMARRVAEYLRSKGFLPVRITNAESFREPRTRIYYSSGYEEQAYRLAFHFPKHHEIEVVSRPPMGNAAMRVVIGKDIARYTSLFE